MASLQFTFSNPPVNGELISDWIDLSVYRGMSTLKTFGMGSPLDAGSGPYQNLETIIEFSSDSPLGVDRQPFRPTIATQRGAKWSVPYEGSINFARVRLQLANLPTPLPTIPIVPYVGFEYDYIEVPPGQWAASTNDTNNPIAGSVLNSLTIPDNWNLILGVEAVITVTTTSTSPFQVQLQRTGYAPLTFTCGPGGLDEVIPRAKANAGDVYKLVVVNNVTGEVASLLLIAA